MAEYTQSECDEATRRSLTALRLSTYLPIATPYTTASLPSGAPTKINIPTTVKASNGFAWDTVNNRFYLSEPGVVDREFELTSSTSMAVGTGNNIIDIELYKNGVVEEGCTVERKVSTAGDVGAVPLVGTILLSTNDYLEIYATADTGGTITFSRTSINLKEIN